MSDAVKRRKIKHRIFFVIKALILFAAVVFVWYLNKEQYQRLKAKEAQRDEQDAKCKEIQKQTDEINEKVSRFNDTSDNFFIERLAREQGNMMKEGETRYDFDEVE